MGHPTLGLPRQSLGPRTPQSLPSFTHGVLGIVQVPSLNSGRYLGRNGFFGDVYISVQLESLGCIVSLYHHLRNHQANSNLGTSEAPTQHSIISCHQITMSGRLEGKIALVSGSTQGFGRGILETFIREGAVVLGMDLQATDGPVDGFPESVAYQIKANVAEEGSWIKAVCKPNNFFHFYSSTCLILFDQRLTSCCSWRLLFPNLEKRLPLSSTTPAGHTPTSLAWMSLSRNSIAFSMSTSEASTLHPRYSFPK